MSERTNMRIVPVLWSKPLNDIGLGGKKKLMRIGHRFTRPDCPRYRLVLERVK